MLNKFLGLISGANNSTLSLENLNVLLKGAGTSLDAIVEEAKKRASKTEQTATNEISLLNARISDLYDDLRVQQNALSNAVRILRIADTVGK